LGEEVRRIAASRDGPRCRERFAASNRRDEQEMSVLYLHIAQAAVVYVNT